MFISISVIMSAVFFIVFMIIYVLRILYDNTKLVDKVVDLNRQLQDENIIVEDKNIALRISYDQLDRIQDIINETT